MDNSKTPNVTKQKISKCYKTQIVTKLGMWQNLECDKTKNSKGDKTIKKKKKKLKKKKIKNLKKKKIKKKKKK